jgi:hypothetical protein
MYFAQAVKIMKDNGINSRIQAAKELLTGNMDDFLPFKLGDISLYTKKVGSVSIMIFLFKTGFSECEII